MSHPNCLPIATTPHLRSLLVRELGDDLDRAVTAWRAAMHAWDEALDQMMELRADPQRCDAALDAVNRARAEVECCERVKASCSQAYERAFAALEGK